MDNREYIIGIDIGSSSVVMAVGLRNEGGEMSVLGVDVQSIEDCVKDGDITNYIGLGNAIAKAKSALESELGLRLNSAYVGISGRSVYCVRYEDYVDINEKTGCVSENELRELTARIEMVTSGGADEIVERIPLRYTIDDHQHVQNPLGYFGSKLSATYLFVLVGKHQIDRVNRALYRAEIKVCGLCVNPTLLPELLLTPDEKEEGVAIVDIGSDLTDISIVRDGKLWYFSSLPIGASSINNDLHEFLKISKKDIDSLKRRFGSAIAANVPDATTIPVKMAGHAKKQILQRNIAEIAEERLKDIAGFVARELKAAKFSTKIPCGVVLTGGSAYLSNIDQLFARELNVEVRFGSMMNGLDDESQMKVIAFPQSVVMGLLCYGAKHNACETMREMLPSMNVNVGDATKTTPEVKPIDIFTSVEKVVPVIKPTAPQTLEEETTPKPTSTPIIEEPVRGDEVEQPIQEELKEVSEESKTTEETTVNNTTATQPKESKKRGWLDKFREWLDERFVPDQYI